MRYREIDFIVAQKNGSRWNIHGLIEDEHEATEYAATLRTHQPKRRVIIARRVVTVGPVKLL